MLVLGAGKSAHDCSVLAASEAAKTASVTTLFRQAHWPLPREVGRREGVGPFVGGWGWGLGEGLVGQLNPVPTELGGGGRELGGIGKMALGVYEVCCVGHVRKEHVPAAARTQRPRSGGVPGVRLGCKGALEAAPGTNPRGPSYHQHQHPHPHWLRLHFVKKLMHLTPPTPTPPSYACCLLRYTSLYQSLQPPTSPAQIFGIPFHKIVYTRFTAAMLPAYYTGAPRLV